MPNHHDVDWHGTFRGTMEDPRECGWCDVCARDVYDGEGPEHKKPTRLDDYYKMGASE